MLKFIGNVAKYQSRITPSTTQRAVVSDPIVY